MRRQENMRRKERHSKASEEQQLYSGGTLQGPSYMTETSCLNDLISVNYLT